jgi:two-component system chemotaxis response regulator CheY
MRTILARYLQDMGYEVLQAGDGQQALEVLAANPDVEVALIDWNMPVMNGLELVEACRADERLRAITLMMVTTESELTQIVRALAAGAHEYLIKPFTRDALEEKLDLLGLGATT